MPGPDLKDAKAARPVIENNKTAVDKTLEMVDTKGAMRQFDAMDEEAIIAGITGQPTENLIYSFPIKTKNGPAKIYGVGFTGINEIARIYGGIKRHIKEIRRVHEDGQYKWRATAIAVDVLTGNQTEATVTQKAEHVAQQNPNDKRDMRSDFSEIIARSKAKRNAVSELIPQGIRQKLIDWGKDGKKAFTEKEARALVASFGGEARWERLEARMLKLELMDRYPDQAFRALTENQIASTPAGAATTQPAKGPTPGGTARESEAESRQRPASSDKPPAAPASVDEFPPAKEPPPPDPKESSKSTGAKVTKRNVQDIHAAARARGIEKDWVNAWILDYYRDVYDEQLESVSDIPRKFYEDKIKTHFDTVDDEGRDTGIAYAILLEKAVDGTLDIGDQDARSMTLNDLKAIAKARMGK